MWRRRGGPEAAPACPARPALAAAPGTYAADDGRGGPLRAYGDRERALRAELVGDDQLLLLGVRRRDVRARDDVVAVHGDRGVRPGGERFDEQDLAGGRVEGVQVAVERGGEHDVVGHRR